VATIRVLTVTLCLAAAIGCSGGRQDGSSGGGYFGELIGTSPDHAAGSGGEAAGEGQGGDETSSAEPVDETRERSPAARLEPGKLRYAGAFRLPGEFGWGARGASFRPGAGQGTLLVTGFELPRTPAGRECTGPGPGCVALFGEVRIPAPVKGRRFEQLPEAELVRPVVGFDGGRVRQLSEFAWVSDLEYVPAQGSRQRSDLLYGSLNLWYAEGERGERTFPTIWVAGLDGRGPRGLFHVGRQGDAVFHGRKAGDYLFRVPRWYADRYLGGRILVTGRARGTPADGREAVTTRGGSQGPTLFAFHPVADGATGGDLDALPMLYYRTKFPACAGPNVGDGARCDFPGYTMCDLWDGASFVEGGSGRAILLGGLKGQGPNCYDEPPVECHDPCSTDHGYHCHPYERQVLFYDADEIGRAARGEVRPWTVLPYAVWRPAELLGRGRACFGLGGMTFDPATRRLFVVERGLGGAEENAAAVHVWLAE
jgi:hypothetical protein